MTLTLSQPTPELPVRDVRKAQEYYRDCFGFEIGWHHEEGRIGAVSRGDCALFFRETDGPITPVVLWMFSADVDGAFAAFEALGATLSGPPKEEPWGLRQFTVTDFMGHEFHVFCD
ncbi:VOC family protein [Pacificoceanicola onchidii]|uniref:VOC family protein n=1 Tax=Pacificoceanicola onchidii TaxID=2562685 RepID=UPI0010A4B09D|nr:VOC family protein [Pacificoceanicola onchidii]